MKNAMMIIFVFVISLGSGTASAQNRTAPADTVADLKLQLIDLSAKEEMTRLKVHQLEEALKPGNIERSLAGIGSTRPEELREQRRRQLLIEKKAADAQLEQLQTRRSELEAALSNAEIQAYQQSAKASPSVDNYFGLSMVTPRGLRFITLITIVSLVSIGVGLLVLRHYVNRV